MGAHDLAALAGQQPLVMLVAAPRHADCLLVYEPLNAAFAPAAAELARGLPEGAPVILYRPPDLPALTDETPGATVFPHARRITACTAAALQAAYAQGRSDALPVAAAFPSLRADLVDLPQEHELATEFTVFSLGPAQPFTAGPARFWLICDGEQVVQCRPVMGYAARGIAGQMHGMAWAAAAELAAWYDPLAPVASRLAFVQAVEHLQGITPNAASQGIREQALAVERAHNALWWSVRFLRLLALEPLARRAAQLAMALDAVLAGWTPEPIAAWLAPQRPAPVTTPPDLASLARAVRDLAATVRRDRWLHLRTVGIGQINGAILHSAGVTGSALTASTSGAGDIQARLVARLTMAATTLTALAELAAAPQTTPTVAGRQKDQQADWYVPAGTATGAVAGPRGTLAVDVTSDGGIHPAHVAWHAPSAALLSLVPALLAGQKVADAEMILASLDLVTAEVDG